MPIYVPGKVVLAKDYTEGDRYFGNVSLLLHGDGTNGSTTIVDSSPSPKTVTALGNAQISTAQSKFGGASIAFDGSDSQLSTAVSSTFGFGLADFTIEFFVYSNVSGTQILVDMRNVTPNEAAPTVYQSGTSLYYFSNNTNKITASSALIANTWQHIAVARASGITKMFVDGAQVGSSYTDSTDYLSPRSVRIGSYFDRPVSYVLNGYIDEFRITKGIARYTSNFTPPTEPFADGQY